MKVVDYILEQIGKEKVSELDLYVLELCTKEFKEFENEDEIKANLDAILEKFLNKLSYQEMQQVKSYTGLSFRKVNSVLRNCWDYEVNGRLTDEIREEAYNIASIVRTVLLKSESLPFPLKAFRGVSLSAFRSYGVYQIKDLINLKDQYIFEDAFTSTSLLRSESFFYKKTDWGERANIEIEYLIPAECDDGSILNIEDLSYSPNQNEYLFNSGSLFKVINVEVDEASNTAKMQMAVIPQKVWDPYDYEMERKTRGLI